MYLAALGTAKGQGQELTFSAPSPALALGLVSHHSASHSLRLPLGRGWRMLTPRPLLPYRAARLGCWPWSWHFLGVHTGWRGRPVQAGPQEDAGP